MTKWHPTKNAGGGTANFPGGKAKLCTVKKLTHRWATLLLSEAISNPVIDVAGMKRTCRRERVPQGVSSVQGEGREALPAHVTTCATASPSPAHEGPKLI